MIREQLPDSHHLSPDTTTIRSNSFLERGRGPWTALPKWRFTFRHSPLNESSIVCSRSVLHVQELGGVRRLRAYKFRQKAPPGEMEINEALA